MDLTAELPIPENTTLPTSPHFESARPRPSPPAQHDPPAITEYDLVYAPQQASSQAGPSSAPQLTDGQARKRARDGADTDDFLAVLDPDLDAPEPGTTGKKPRKTYRVRIKAPHETVGNGDGHAPSGSHKGQPRSSLDNEQHPDLESIDHPTPNADPTQPPHDPLDGLDPAAVEEARKKKEMNRVAAERSRSKKRGELAILERTVTNIQAENDRLRTQLEALLNAAAGGTNGGSGGVAVGSGVSMAASGGPSGGAAGVGRADGVGQAGPSSMMTSSVVGQREDPEAGPGGSTGQQVLLPQILLPGTAGLNLSLLSDLIAEVNALEADVKRKETALDSIASSSRDHQHVHPTAATSSPSLDHKQVERQALMATIEVLSREREEVELERKALEREIALRKEIVAAAANRGRSTGLANGSGLSQEDGLDILPEANDLGHGAQDPAGPGSGAGTRAIDPALWSVGVERALLDVRSWLDDALSGWKRTGIIPSPASTTPVIINPPVKLIRKTPRARQQAPPSGQRNAAGASSPQGLPNPNFGPSDINLERGLASANTHMHPHPHGHHSGLDVHMTGQEHDEEETNEDYLPADDGPAPHLVDMHGLGAIANGAVGAGGVTGIHDGVFDGMEGLDEHEHEDGGEYVSMEVPQ